VKKVEIERQGCELKLIAKEVISLKKKRKMKLPNAIIVATALVEGAILYANDKQLHSVENLNIRYFGY